MVQSRDVKSETNRHPAHQGVKLATYTDFLVQATV
jgi:hypothetical protein